MTNSIACPNCGKTIRRHQRYCESCGVDLIVYAVLAEQTIHSQSDLSKGIPITPEVLVPRLGEYMLQNGLLEKKQLEQALQYQKQRATSEKPLLLGQALLELGMISRETLDNVITSQILALQTALKNANQTLQQRVDERTKDLQQAFERLSELNTLKLNFISNISHELRTPLTHIKGYLELLSDDGLGPLNAEQTEALRILKKAENRLATLIEDLIQFSLASRGELALKLQPTDIEKIIRFTVERICQKEKAKQIQLQVKVMKTLPQIKVDEDKISWVFFQILDNAIKFTPKGGLVVVKAFVKDNFLKVTFSDTGIGIPKERLEEIFEPFHQLDGSMTRRYGGIGLGLVMVRTIVEAHGAHISVESVPEKGSHFEISFLL